MKKLISIVLIFLTLTISCTGCTEPGRESLPSTDAESSTVQHPTDSGDESSAPTPGAAPDTSIASPSEPSNYSFEPRTETVYTTTNLNIRTAPSTDADVLVMLAPERKLVRTGYHEEWSRLEYNGKTVYAASDYLTTVVPTFSNESIYYGYDRNTRDEKNIPGLINWYIRNWSNQADFILDTESNLIYLTLDEGYENGYTPLILDVLREKNVTCVFFLTKGFVDSQPELVQRMIDEGHILGNHTCTHPINGMPSLPVDEQEEDIMTLHRLVLDQFGYEMKLFRFPSGIYSDLSLDLVSSLGYRSVFWTVTHNDFDPENQPDPATALNQCLSELHPGAIYLLHAVSQTNAEILADFIDGVRDMGYEFGVYPVD